MKNLTIEEGVVHKVPDDLKKILLSNSELLENGMRLPRWHVMSGFVGPSA